MGTRSCAAAEAHPPALYSLWKQACNVSLVWVCMCCVWVEGWDVWLECWRGTEWQVWTQLGGAAVAAAVAGEHILCDITTTRRLSPSQLPAAEVEFPSCWVWPDPPCDQHLNCTAAWFCTSSYLSSKIIYQFCVVCCTYEFYCIL